MATGAVKNLLKCLQEAAWKGTVCYWWTTRYLIVIWCTCWQPKWYFRQYRGISKSDVCIRTTLHFTVMQPLNPAEDSTISQYKDIQNLRQYLGSYHNTHIISIYFPALLISAVIHWRMCVLMDMSACLKIFYAATMECLGLKWLKTLSLNP